MTLGLPARANRALEALQLGHWFLVNAEYVAVHRKVRTSFERPSGEIISIEFKIEPPAGSDTEEWIESELITRLRALI